jgi:hypothetical protein
VRIDTLALLLVAEPVDLAAIEGTLTAIVERLDELAEGSPAHVAAHRRVDQLLVMRDRAVVAALEPGGG